MKRLLILLLALLTFSALADPVFVVNGQAVPASSISGTISITTTGTPPPPTCTPPFVSNGIGGCVCPPGTTLSGTTCVTPVPIPGVSIRAVTFPAGNAYNTVWGNVQPPAQGDAEIVAWKFVATSLVGGGNYGSIQLYSSSAPYDACFSASPGLFDSGVCFKGITSGDKAGMTYLGWTRAPLSGYSKLPAPSADGYLYLNVRKVNSAAYDGIPLAYYPLYQPQ